MAPLRFTTAPAVYHCERGWHWRPGPLRDFDLWCVLDGIGALSVGKRKFELKAGACFLFPPGAEPRATQNPENRLTVFYTHFVLRERMPLPGLRTDVIDMAFLTTLTRRCEAAFRRGGTLGRRQSVLCLQQALLLLIEEKASPAASLADSKMSELIRELQTDPSRRWTVDALAAAAHLSRSQFTRRFIAATGLAPNRFVLRARVERARRLIAETDMTLGEIADALNYRDVYFFSRQYKQLTGQSPGAHRKTAKA